MPGEPSSLGNIQSWEEEDPMRKYPLITWAMFGIAAILAVILFVALFSLEQDGALAETISATDEEREEILEPESEEYWDCVSALYRAFYDVPREWAEVLAKYLDVKPFSVVTEEPRILEVADLGLSEPVNQEAALYWVIASDKYGSLIYGSVFSNKDDHILAWPVVDPEKVSEEFANIVSRMQPGEIWEFIAYEKYFGVLKYIVLATPDTQNIKPLRLRLDELAASN